MKTNLVRSTHFDCMSLAYIKNRASNPINCILNLMKQASIAIILLMTLSSTVHAELAPAGVVSMTIGKAYLNGKTVITTGTKLHEGDRIETLSNGHVYIRFIDNGLVSVRPESHLHIEHYQYNANAPSDSVIKFNLSEGVMRSISGSGAKSARDKFRLNTPIAAIGVRGTDFVVKASSSLIQAVVNEGAIIVAPFSDDCNADSFGPCSKNSVELDDKTKQLLEVSTLTSTPRLIPLSESFAAELRNSLSEEKTSSLPGESDVSTTDNTKTKTDNNSSTSKQSTTSMTASSFSVASTLTGSSDENRDELNNIVQVYLANDTLVPESSNPDNYVPETPLSLDTLSERRLVWGRWSHAAEATDRIITTRPIALSLGKNDIGPGVGGVGGYAIYRDNSALDSIDRTLGKVSFSLVDAQATLTTELGGASMMEVSGGRLDVDFSTGAFKTSLITKHPLTSEIILSTSGIIDNNGFINEVEDNGYIKGATTLEGDAALYEIHKDIDVGSIDASAYFNR